MQRYSPSWYTMRAVSGAVLGILGVILLVRVIMISAPIQEKIIGFLLPVAIIALAVVRVREYLHGRKPAP